MFGRGQSGPGGKTAVHDPGPCGGLADGQGWAQCAHLGMCRTGGLGLGLGLGWKGAGVDDFCWVLRALFRNKAL